MSVAFVFPGQGSQQVGMMSGFAGHRAVRDTFAEASEALGDDLWKLVDEGPAEALGLTRNTQPAMLTAGVAVWRAWQAASGRAPAFMAGHSLGEYSALVAAGALAFRDAVPLVRFRAEAMQDAVAAGVGAMAAVIGADDAAVAEACREAAQGEVVEPVNYNAPGQIVIAGTKAGIERAIDVAKQRGKRAIPLPVSAPFHCELMKPAEERLKPVLDDAHLKDLWFSVVSNVDASPIGTATAVRNALVRQVASPVRWVESVQKMVSMGVKRFVEIGPGNVLTGLIKRIDRSVELINVSDVASLEAFVQKAAVQ